MSHPVAQNTYTTYHASLLDGGVIMESVIKLTTSKPAWVSGACLFFLLRLAFMRLKNKGKYVTKLDSIGRRVRDGKDLTLPVDAPEYDVVVVGGGTAGCVIASRLSENPEIRVLLLESGGSGQAQAMVHVPSAFSRLFNFKDLVHNFYTVPQGGSNGAKKFFPRARMLGGCSSINAHVAQYGARGDFDEWASIIGDESWAWKNLSKYFRKFESFRPHPDYPLVDQPVRGGIGPVQVGFFSTITLWCDAFIKSSIAAGIPPNHDFDGADLNPIGVGRVVTYINTKHRRVSSESAYLTPDVLARKNLTIAIHATVTRVITDTASGKPRAIGVEFANEESGPRFRVRAKKEVVVCGGTVQSPTILMLSGIGPADHLKEKGIPVVCDLPGVGANLLDHPAVYIPFKQNGVVHSLSFLRPKTIRDRLKLFGAIVQHRFLNMGGPLSMNFVEAAAFVRTDDPVLFPTSEYPEVLVDTTSAKDSPDIELFVVPTAAKEHGKVVYDVDTFSICVYLLRPSSSGSILLKSASAFDHPVINPEYLQTHEDIAKLVRGIRLGLKIVQQEPLKSLSDLATSRQDFDHIDHLETDSEIETFVRERVETIYHPTSTCKMAKQEDGGVVDARLHVYGVAGLRVCDASIFPTIVSGHLAGACFAIGEKLADMMQSEFGI